MQTSWKRVGKFRL